MFTATFRGDKFLKIRAAYFGGPTFELFQQSKSDEATLTRRVVYACTSADRWASLMKDPVVARILVPFIVDTLNEQTFYCPAGHSLHYGDNEADRLRRELADEKARSRSIASSRDYAFSELRETEAKLTQKKRLYTRTRNELTKVKTRVAAGVCPDCNRSFQNVARHMATKHPKE
jgi:hypothetical protein